VPIPSPEPLTLKRTGADYENILIALIGKERVWVEWMPVGPARRLTPEEFEKVSPNSTVNQHVSP